MYEPDEDRADDEDGPAYDWDEWERDRLRGRGRWWLLVMVVTMVAMTALWFQSDGTFIPWGPPR